MADEDGVGALGGEALAILRGAGLEDHRLALGRALDVERPLHLEELALVVERVQLVRIDEDAALLVGDVGVVLPGVPEPLHHVQVLARQPIAHVVGQVVGAAEVGRAALQPGGHHVPPGAPAGDVIQG